MRWTDVDADDCAVTAVTDVMGDRWSVLVLREIFNGVRRFDEIAEHLGVSRSVLAQRLKRFVDLGVLQRREYQPPGERARHEYRLTPMGRDLQVVLHAIMNFGDRWLSAGEPLVTIHHRGCDGRVRAVNWCEHGHVVDEPRELYAQVAGVPLS